MEQTHKTHEGSAKTYIFGFLLSVILTVIPFWLVMNGMIKSGLLVTVVLLFGIAQLLVQLYLFMHLGNESKPRYNLLSTAYAFLVILIFALGSIWVMYNLDRHGSGHAMGLEQRQMSQDQMKEK